MATRPAGERHEFWLRPTRKLALALACAGRIALVVAGAEALADPSPGEPRQGLYVLDPVAGEPKLLFAGEEDDPAWSPDARWITAFDPNGYYLNVVDPEGRIRHRVHSLSWSNK